MAIFYVHVYYDLGHSVQILPVFIIEFAHVFKTMLLHGQIVFAPT